MRNLRNAESELRHPFALETYLKLGAAELERLLHVDNAVDRVHSAGRLARKFAELLEVLAEDLDFDRLAAAASHRLALEVHEIVSGHAGNLERLPANIAVDFLDGPDAALVLALQIDNEKRDPAVVGVAAGRVAYDGVFGEDFRQVHDNPLDLPCDPVRLL